MKKFLIMLGLMMSLGGVVYGFFWWGWPVVSPKSEDGKKRIGYLEKYDFDSLKNRGGRVSRLIIDGDLPGVELRRKGKVTFESKRFFFESEGKKITGMINIPMTARSNKMAAIIMIRGYADKAGYYTGSGTWRVADKLAKEGLVTVSLDFLGFGGSDGESTNMLEARFEKVPAVLDLIVSVRALDFVDEDKIGLWAHSNGGQMALSVLEILGEDMPTVLWAPMTNPFPASILDTADELDDGGKMVIAAIAEFEKNYDVRRYSFENYYGWVMAPIVIHQGTADIWCEVSWQEKVRDDLRALGREAELYVWKEDDHNLSRNWEEVVKIDVEFFERKFGIMQG